MNESARNRFRTSRASGVRGYEKYEGSLDPVLSYLPEHRTKPRTGPEEVRGGARARRPAPSVGTARDPDAHRATTNGFMIRNSRRLSNNDSHLPASSNGFLMAADVAAVNATVRTTTEMR
jgi:hypothetical protein